MEYDVSRCNDDREYGKTSFVIYVKNLVNYFPTLKARLFSYYMELYSWLLNATDRQATACF